MSDEMAYHEVALEKMLVAADGRLGAFVRASVDMRRAEDQLTGDLIYRLSAHVLAERLLDTEVTVPFTGPVSVRLGRLRGAWRCLRGKPVETWVSGQVTVPATLWARFPESSIVPNDRLGPVYRFAQLGSPLWEQGDDPC